MSQQEPGENKGMMEKGKEFFEKAGETMGEYVHVAKEKAEVSMQRTKEATQTAMDKTSEQAGHAKEKGKEYTGMKDETPHQSANVTSEEAHVPEYSGAGQFTQGPKDNTQVIKHKPQQITEATESIKATEAEVGAK